MRIGCGSQCQVGQCEKHATLCAVSGIEVLRADGDLCLTVSGPNFNQFDTHFPGKMVVFKEFLWSHINEGLRMKKEEWVRWK